MCQKYILSGFLYRRLLNILLFYINYLFFINFNKEFIKKYILNFIILPLFLIKITILIFLKYFLLKMSDKHYDRIYYMHIIW